MHDAFSAPAARITAPEPRAERTLLLPTGLSMTFSCRTLPAEDVDLMLERVLGDAGEERE